MTVSEYIRGAVNYARATVKPDAPQALIEARMQHCMGCDHLERFPRLKCGACGCMLPHKTMLKDQSCPVSKW